MKILLTLLGIVFLAVGCNSTSTEQFNDDASAIYQLNIMRDMKEETELRQQRQDRIFKQWCEQNKKDRYAQEICEFNQPLKLR